MSSVDPTSSGDGTPPPWYRQFWPWFLISLPGSVVVASIITINLAIKTDDGLVTEDYYKKGLAIHRDADALLKARQLGIQAAFMPTENGGKLLLNLTSDSNLAFSELRVDLRHPTRSRLDLSRVAEPVGPNRYQVDLPDDLAAGEWIIQLSAPEAGWRLRGRIQPHGNGKVVLR